MISLLFSHTPDSSPDKNADHTLMQRLKEGDTEALAVLIDRYEPKLRRYLKRISTYDDDTLDDILQEVFIQLYRNAHLYDDRFSLSAWLYRIARNKTISLFRWYRNRITVSLDAEAVQQFAKQEETLTADVEYELLSQALKQALDELPDRYKEVFMLRYFEEKSYIEIADILKIPTGTVSTILHRSKKMLQDKLRAYEKH